MESHSDTRHGARDVESNMTQDGVTSSLRDLCRGALVAT